MNINEILYFMGKEFRLPEKMAEKDAVNTLSATFYRLFNFTTGLLVAMVVNKNINLDELRRELEK